MANKEIKTSIEINNEEQNNLSSQLKNFFWWSWDKLKWLFSKNTNEKKIQNTRRYLITKKSSIQTLFLSFVILIIAVLYGLYTKGNYEKINQQANKLTEMSELWLRIEWDNLNEFLNWNSTNKLIDLFQIKENINSKLNNLKEIKESQQRYYNIFLNNLYLPSINVWKNPFTEEFDASILGQKFLEKDKFQDLYLIDYWSNYIKYVWNDADYNTINSITIWDLEEIEWWKYFTIPITVSFSSPNKRSFLLLVNKLSMTSNTTNIALLNEFFYYLIANIKTYKEKEIKQLMEQYRTIFESSPNRDWFWTAKNISELSEEQYSKYSDKVIWYHLYQWIQWLEENNVLIDENIIVTSIKENSLCDESMKNQECFYSFREKYRNLPYLAYWIWLEKQNDRLEWLHEFLKGLASIISISSFDFNKVSKSSFLKNTNEQYNWTVQFIAYWRSITNEEIEETAKNLWNICLWNEVMSPTNAKNKVSRFIESLWWEDTPRNTTSMEELESIIDEIEKNYNQLSNYQKVIKLFELWRMLNDANLCI